MNLFPTLTSYISLLANVVFKNQLSKYHPEKMLDMDLMCPIVIKKKEKN